MKMRQDGDGVAISELKNFDIGEILECGQCFRFDKLGDMEYSLIAYDKALYARQIGDTLHLRYPGKPLNTAEFTSTWLPYFDLDRDYAAILADICKDDAVMTAAADFAPGIRLLRQDPWETIISFIISQNNRIPQIKNVIRNISAQFGAQIDGTFHAFPTVAQLAAATEADLRSCKAGFRAKYIMDATRKAAAGDLPLGRDCDMPTAQLRQTLLGVSGIGEKVAHCILLFGYGRYDSFPVDTWVRKVMEGYYFDGKPTKAEDIHKLATQRFGEYAGFAQQYLFHYIRTKNRENENKSE